MTGAFLKILKTPLLKQAIHFSSVIQSCLTLRPHRLQRARLPCLSPTPGVCSDSCPSSQWCHPTISSSVVPFSSCLQSFPASNNPSSQPLLQGWRKERQGTKAWFFFFFTTFSVAWGRSYPLGTSESIWLLAHSALTIFGARISFVPSISFVLKLFEMNSSLLALCETWGWLRLKWENVYKLCKLWSMRQK